jgi:hypothetical protein
MDFVIIPDWCRSEAKSNLSVPCSTAEPDRRHTIMGVYLK